MELSRMAFDQAWQLTTLVIVAWLTTRIVARNRPHLAYMLWLVVLLKAVTPPVWSSPIGIFSWAQTSTSNAVDLVLTSPDAVDDSRPPLLSQSFSAPYEHALASGGEPVTEWVMDQPAADSPNPQSIISSTQRVFDTFVVVWCVGLLAALVVTAVRWSKCIYLLRVAPTVDRPDLVAIVKKLSRQLRIKRRIALLVTTSRIGPAVVGLFRPTIVLPEIIVRGKRADELEAIIAHELLHVRRGDLWLGLLQVSAKAVWWFHPLVWWASRMSTQEAERCCDEEVIGELRCDSKRYARSLLEVLELKRTLRTVPAFPGMKPVEVTFQRLERIMKLGQGCNKRTPRWCWAVMLLLAAGSLPGAALVLASDESAQPDATAVKRLQVVGDGVTSDTEPTFAACYAVADLLKEDLQWLNQPQAASGKDRSAEQRASEILIASIMERVDPESWDEAAGPGAIEAFLTQQWLVISQTEGGHKKVHAYLNDIRCRMGIAPKTEQPPPIGLRRGKSRRVDTDCYLKTYNVADFVSPISVIRAPMDLPRNRKPSVAAFADFDSVVALITSTIAPNSWDCVGGQGLIEPFPTDLSVVISQTADVHDQIVDLLQHLRRLHKVQITVETRFLRVPKSLLSPKELPSFVVRDFLEIDVRGKIKALDPMRLSESKAAELLKAAAQDTDSQVASEPTVTLFNGQRAAISATENGRVDSTLQFEVVISHDRQFVHFKVAADGETKFNILWSERMRSGEALLLRIDESVAKAWMSSEDKSDEIAILRNLPDPSGLLKNDPAPDARIALLLVTPKIVVVDQEKYSSK